MDSKMEEYLPHVTVSLRETIVYTLISWCCMCRCSEEMVDHLLLNCIVAFDLWNFTFRSFGMNGCY